MLMLLTNFMQQAQPVIPSLKELKELQTPIWLLSGGVGIIILVIVFNFIKGILPMKAMTNGKNGMCKFMPFRDSQEFKEFSKCVSIAHDRAQGSLDRIERESGIANDVATRLTVVFESLEKGQDRQITILEDIRKDIREALRGVPQNK